MVAVGSNITEPASSPAVIVAGFTAGCLINRRRNGYHHHDDPQDDLEAGDRFTDASPNLKPTMIHSERAVRKSPNLFFSLLSRFFNKYPFLIEIWYWNLTYWIYQGLRAFSARMIAGNEAVFARAQAHSIQIVNFEKFIGVYIEQRFQEYVMTQQAWLMPIIAKIYYLHISAGIIYLVYIYTYLPPTTFQRIRRTIAADNVISFFIVTTYRCMPPRMLPQEYGFIDVLHSTTYGGANAWNHNRFQLTIAAMPSLHFGTSLFIAVTLSRFSPHRIIRLLAPIWPLAMIITITATANHFLTDAAVGAGVTLLGWKYNHLILYLKPIQDFIFGPLVRRLDLVNSSPRSVPKAL
ncbi:Fc.00g009210.m01.CDS01 [Cosmosporella sp. VM-42]